MEELTMSAQNNFIVPIVGTRDKVKEKKRTQPKAGKGAFN